MIKVRKSIILLLVLAVSLIGFVSCSRDGDDAEQTAEQCRTDENKDTNPKRLFVCFFVEENEKNADEERPKHVLVQRRDP